MGQEDIDDDIDGDFCDVDDDNDVIFDFEVSCFMIFSIFVIIYKQQKNLKSGYFFFF